MGISEEVCRSSGGLAAGLSVFVSVAMEGIVSARSLQGDLEDRRLAERRGVGQVPLLVETSPVAVAHVVEGAVHHGAEAGAVVDRQVAGEHLQALDPVQ